MRIYYSDLFSNFYKYKRKLCSRAFSVTKFVQCRKVPRVLFFGTDSFSLPSLVALNSNASNLGVVTSFKSPANCVRAYAEKLGMPLFRWPIEAADIASYELGVVVSFGHLIPEKVINSFPLGMINVHASLLPRWRGAAPIIYALMHGDPVTGVSIMKIEPKHFDIGDILDQRTVPIKDNCFMPELHENLAKQGAELLVEVVNNFEDKLKTARNQNNQLVTFAPRITPELTEIDWISWTADDVHRRYRALYGYRNLLTKFHGKNVQLIELNLVPHEATELSAFLQHLKRPGDFCYRRDRKSLLVRCERNTFIEIHRLRIEGKKVMNAMEFNNGFLKKIEPSQMYFMSKQNNKQILVQ